MQGESNVKSQKTLAALVGLPVLTLLAACASEPTLTERNFGTSVRQMIEAQTYDPSTLATPSTETVDTADGRRLENVLEAYRTDVAKPESVSEDIVISVDGQR
jgi:type IV pilus biogenesis protein CpaD/CtpE